MGPDQVSTVACAVIPFVGGNKREISRLDVAPDPFMALFWLQRVMKVAEGHQVLRGVCSTICNRAHVMNVKFQS